MALKVPTATNSTTTPTPNAYFSSSLYSRSLISKPSKVFINGKPHHAFKVSCKSTDDENNEQTSSSKFDRRNVILGLGGLYGAANLSVAAPVVAPDISKCGPSEYSNGTVINTDCCPPSATNIIDFKFPKPSEVMRVRPSAHLASDEYVAKFSKAIELMKALPEDDPRNFMQQARVHCAYCNGAYQQVGFLDLDLQIHNSWLFYPFHRWYLYFYEKILAKLIGDPSFALPFWNWDTPRGMQVPSMFLDTSSSLYNEHRNASHLPMVIDLGYNGVDTDTTDVDKITANLAIMYRQMVPNASTAELFFGSAYRAGDNPSPGAGSIETTPHTAVHRWIGDPNQPNGEDLGNFYSAGRDTLFYCHHANVDRMWTIWKTLGGKRTDITDPDWLNSSFLFYDEDAQLVRVKVGDCLDNRKLGFEFQKVDMPWLQSKPTPRSTNSTVAGAPGSNAAANAANTAAAKVVFPVKLDKDVKVLVSRPKKARSRKAKDEASEVLVIEGIDYDTNKYVKFDVFINDEDIDGTHATPAQTEFAGSFTNLPHHHKHGKRAKSNIHFGLTDILEDLEAEDDENVLVTLVPKSGSEDITISGIKIKLASRK
ncbi:hypothetical protein LguiA_022942 [Lonicera macranthoides]